MTTVHVINRSTAVLEQELVFGDGILSWLYETRSGRAMQDILCRKWLSKIYGSWQSSRMSHSNIQPFIEKFDIDMTEFLSPKQNAAEAYGTFNDFFIRQFLPGKREFCQGDNLGAPAEGRYSAYEQLDEHAPIHIKGHRVNSAFLLRDEKLAATFSNGPALIARLCPADYHRFHFPDDGTVIKQFRIPGMLHSVGHTPMALRDDILFTNDRRVSILDLKHFGKIAMIEVGALCVGTIVETHDPFQPFRRGAEKGYFMFGGSTVVILGERAAWNIDPDLIHNTKAGRETLVRLGAKIGSAEAGPL